MLALWHVIPDLELLGFVVLQPFHNGGESLFVVPLCRNCHGGQDLIQAGGIHRNGKHAQHKSQQTLLSPHWQDIYWQFSAQTPCILSSYMSWSGCFAGQSLVTAANAEARSWFPFICVKLRVDSLLFDTEAELHGVFFSLSLFFLIKPCSFVKTLVGELMWVVWKDEYIKRTTRLLRRHLWVFKVKLNKALDNLCIKREILSSTYRHTQLPREEVTFNVCT